MKRKPKYDLAVRLAVKGGRPWQPRPGHLLRAVRVCESDLYSIAASDIFSGLREWRDKLQAVVDAAITERVKAGTLFLPKDVPAHVRRKVAEVLAKALAREAEIDKTARALGWRPSKPKRKGVKP